MGGWGLQTQGLDNPKFIVYLKMQHDLAFNGINRIKGAIVSVVDVLVVLNQEIECSD